MRNLWIVVTAMLAACGQVIEPALPEQTSEASSSDELVRSCGDATCGVVNCAWDYEPTWTGGDPTAYCECLPGGSSVGPYPRCRPDDDLQPPTI
jgi:hypothetical protein